MMVSRSILAAVLAVGTAGPALAEVEVDTPRGHVKTPSGGVELDVKIAPKATPSEAWIDRDVYSVDGKHLGEVAAVAEGQVYVDIGGFLGIGESRVLIDTSQIEQVKDDGIVLKLTEAEAKGLPAADDKAAAPKQ
jgi:sporulation protein YlmC with PRC-barrel domain